VAAEGYSVRHQLPVIAMCRLLVAEGFDPASPMHVYRGDTLALKIRSIGEAATLRPSARPPRARWRELSRELNPRPFCILIDVRAA
jgi:hypothetical protein